MGGFPTHPIHRGTILCRSTMRRATPLRWPTSVSPRPRARTRALGRGHQTSNDGAVYYSFPPPWNGASLRLFFLARIRALRRAAPCPRKVQRPSMACAGRCYARVPAGIHPPAPSSQPALPPPAPGETAGNLCGGPLREPPRIPQLIRFGVRARIRIFSRGTLSPSKVTLQKLFLQCCMKKTVIPARFLAAALVHISFFMSTSRPRAQSPARRSHPRIAGMTFYNSSLAWDSGASMKHLQYLLMIVFSVYP